MNYFVCRSGGIVNLFNYEEEKLALHATINRHDAAASTSVQWSCHLHLSVEQKAALRLVPQLQYEGSTLVTMFAQSLDGNPR